MIVIRVQVIDRQGDAEGVLHEQSILVTHSLKDRGYSFAYPISDPEEGIILDGYALTPFTSELPEEMRPLVEPQVDMVHG